MPNTFIDVTNIYNQKFINGIPRIVLNLAKNLESQSESISLVVHQSSSFFTVTYVDLINSRINQVNLYSKIVSRFNLALTRIFHLIPQNNLKEFIRSNSYLVKIRRKKLSPHIVNGTKTIFTHLDTILLADIITDEVHIASLLAAQRDKSLRIVALVYDLIPVFHPEYCVKSFLTIYPRYLKLVEKANSLITVSNTTALELSRYLEESFKGPIHTIFLPVNDFPECAHKSTLQKYRDGSVFIYVSTIAPHKNHKRLIDAYLQIRLKHPGEIMPRLVLIAGTSWWKKNLKEYLTNAKENGYPIEILEKVEDCCLGYLYSVSRFSVYLSEFEGFGLPILESLALRTPVLTSAIGSMLEVSNGGGAIAISPYEITEIKQTLEAFMTNDDLINSLVDQITQRKFNYWDDYSKRIKEVLKSNEL